MRTQLIPWPPCESTDAGAGPSRRKGSVLSACDRALPWPLLPSTLGEVRFQLSACRTWWNRGPLWTWRAGNLFHIRQAFQHATRSLPSHLSGNKEFLHTASVQPASPHHQYTFLIQGVMCPNPVSQYSRVVAAAPSEVLIARKQRQSATPRANERQHILSNVNYSHHPTAAPRQTTSSHSYQADTSPILLKRWRFSTQTCVGVLIFIPQT